MCPTGRPARLGVTKITTTTTIVRVAVGKVVESVPPRRLVLTWAAPADVANEAKHSRVTFEIEPFMDAVRLTVTHDELDSETLRAISQGWPGVLSSLKTLLETGRPMAMSLRRWGKESPAKNL